MTEKHRICPYCYKRVMWYTMYWTAEHDMQRYCLSCYIKKYVL